MIKAELTNQKRGAAIFRNRKGALRGGKRERGRREGGGSLGKPGAFFFCFCKLRWPATASVADSTERSREESTRRKDFFNTAGP